MRRRATPGPDTAYKEWRTRKAGRPGLRCLASARFRSRLCAKRDPFGYPSARDQRIDFRSTGHEAMIRVYAACGTIVVGAIDGDAIAATRSGDGIDGFHRE